MIRRIVSTPAPSNVNSRTVYSSRTFLGGFNDSKGYYLFPHYEEYFSPLAICLQERYRNEQNATCQEFLGRLQALVLDCMGSKIETFEEFVGTLYELKKGHECQSRCLPDVLDSMGLERLRNTELVNISYGLYMRFQKLSLANYLNRLSPNVGVCLQMENIRWIDRNCDKLSRLKIEQLKSLNLNSNIIACEGVRILVENSNWTWLQALFLANNHIKNLGMMYLGKSKWAKLKVIVLHDNMFSDEGVEDFLAREWITVECLDIRTMRTPKIIPFGKEKPDFWFCQLSYCSVQYLLQRHWYSLFELFLFVGQTELCYSKNKHGQLKDYLMLELAKHL